jgi:hypothetical protein
MIETAPRDTRSRDALSIDLHDANTIYLDEGEVIMSGRKRIRPMSRVYCNEIIDEYPVDADTYCAAPVCMTFGMGSLDNLSFFSETTTYKTGLSDGAGSAGLAEGLNWSAAVTPQGSVTAQFGVRAVQGDLFAKPARSQVFLTAGLFKRFDFAPVQGGVAVDWLEDYSHFGTVKLRQMRTELSTRTYSGLEYGFIGGFDVFRDRATTGRLDPFVVEAKDYYLLFARKHLDNGGQVELRCGATAWGDFVFSTQGEVAINDRLAVNGGITMVAPSEGLSFYGNQRESWSMSCGVVYYFRGGACFRQTNLYRPMFDVGGNNSFFCRLVER